MFLLTFVSYSKAQDQTSTGRIVAGCTIGNERAHFIQLKLCLTNYYPLFSGGLFVLFPLLLLVIYASSRRITRPVANGRTNQYESKPLSGGTLERSHPVQTPTTPYQPQGPVQTAPGDLPSSQHDPSFYNNDYSVPPPPAYDSNVKGVYFSVSSIISIILPYSTPLSAILPKWYRRSSDQ